MELEAWLEGDKFATLLVDLTKYLTEAPWGRGGLLPAHSFSRMRPLWLALLFLGSCGKQTVVAVGTFY